MIGVTPRRDDHRWALWSSHRIHHPVDREDTLLVRTRILQTPWFGIYLHRHDRPDRDRVLHDHPWSFVSIVLRGGYSEMFGANLYEAMRHVRKPDVYGRPRTWRPLSMHRVRRGQFHGIRELLVVPTWTLVIVGRRRGSWGYATDHGWVRWDAYDVERRATS